jgi:hypothetical protein
MEIYIQDGWAMIFIFTDASSDKYFAAAIIS